MNRTNRFLICVAILAIALSVLAPIEARRDPNEEYADALRSTAGTVEKDWLFDDDEEGNSPEWNALGEVAKIGSPESFHMGTIVGDQKIHSEHRGLKLRGNLVLVQQHERHHYVVTQATQRRADVSAELLSDSIGATESEEDADNASSDEKQLNSGDYVMEGNDVLRVSQELCVEKGIEKNVILATQDGIFKVLKMVKDDIEPYYEVECKRLPLEAAFESGEFKVHSQNLVMTRYHNKVTGERGTIDPQSLEDNYAGMKDEAEELQRAVNQDVLDYMRGDGLQQVEDVLSDQMMDDDLCEEDKQKFRTNLESARSDYLAEVDSVEDALHGSDSLSVMDSLLNEDETDSEYGRRSRRRGGFASKLRRFARKASKGLKKIAMKAKKAVDKVVKKATKVIKKAAGKVTGFLKKIGSFEFGKKKTFRKLKKSFNMLTIVNKYMSRARHILVRINKVGFSFQPGFTIKGKIAGFRIEYFKATAWGKFKLWLDAIAKLDLGKIRGKKDLFMYEADITVTIGPVPVMISIGIDVVTGFVTNLPLSSKKPLLLRFGLNSNINFEVGGKIVSGKFKPVFIKKDDFKKQLPNKAICSDVYASVFIRPSIRLLIYKMVGPSFELEPSITFSFRGNGMKACKSCKDGETKCKPRKPGILNALMEKVVDFAKDKINKIKKLAEKGKKYAKKVEKKATKASAGINKGLNKYNKFVDTNVNKKIEKLDKFANGKPKKEESDSDWEEEFEMDHKSAKKHAGDAFKEAKAAPGKAVKHTKKKATDALKKQNAKMEASIAKSNAKLAARHAASMSLPKQPATVARKDRDSFWELSVGLRAHVGLQLTLLGRFKIANFQKELFNLKIPLLNGCMALPWCEAKPKPKPKLAPPRATTTSPAGGNPTQAGQAAPQQAGQTAPQQAGQAAPQQAGQAPNVAPQRQGPYQPQRQPYGYRPQQQAYSPNYNSGYYDYYNRYYQSYYGGQQQYQPSYSPYYGGYGSYSPLQSGHGGYGGGYGGYGGMMYDADDDDEEYDADAEEMDHDPTELADFLAEVEADEAYTKSKKSTPGYAKSTYSSRAKQRTKYKPTTTTKPRYMKRTSTEKKEPYKKPSTSYKKKPTTRPSGSTTPGYAKSTFSSRAKQRTKYEPSTTTRKPYSRKGPDRKDDKKDHTDIKKPKKPIGKPRPNGKPNPHVKPKKPIGKPRPNGKKDKKDTKDKKDKKDKETPDKKDEEKPSTFAGMLKGLGKEAAAKLLEQAKTLGPEAAKALAQKALNAAKKKFLGGNGDDAGTTPDDDTSGETPAEKAAANPAGAAAAGTTGTTGTTTESTGSKATVSKGTTTKKPMASGGNASTGQQGSFTGPSGGGGAAAAGRPGCANNFYGMIVRDNDSEMDDDEANALPKCGLQARNIVRAMVATKKAIRAEFAAAKNRVEVSSYAASAGSRAKFRGTFVKDIAGAKKVAAQAWKAMARKIAAVHRCCLVKHCKCADSETTKVVENRKLLRHFNKKLKKELSQGATKELKVMQKTGDLAGKLAKLCKRAHLPQQSLEMKAGYLDFLKGCAKLKKEAKKSKRNVCKMERQIKEIASKVAHRVEKKGGVRTAIKQAKQLKKAPEALGCKCEYKATCGTIHTIVEVGQRAAKTLNLDVSYQKMFDNTAPKTSISLKGNPVAHVLGLTQLLRERTNDLKAGQQTIATLRQHLREIHQATKKQLVGDSDDSDEEEEPAGSWADLFEDSESDEN